MNRARRKAAAPQTSAKLGERGTIQPIGIYRQGAASGEMRTVWAKRPSIDRRVHGRNDGCTGAMLGADIAGRPCGLRGRAVPVLRMRAGVVPVSGLHRDGHVLVARRAETDRDRRHRPHGNERDEKNNS